MKKAKLASIGHVTCSDNFVQLSFNIGDKTCTGNSDENNIVKGKNYYCYCLVLYTVLVSMVTRFCLVVCGKIK